MQKGPTDDTQYDSSCSFVLLVVSEVVAASILHLSHVSVLFVGEENKTMRSKESEEMTIEFISSFLPPHVLPGN